MRARATMRALALGGAVMTAACGGNQPTPAQTAAEAPKPPSAADQAQKYQDCWRDFYAKNWDGLRSCYDPSIELDAVDSGRPLVTGVDGAIADSKTFTDAFPDIGGGLELVVASPDHVAALAVLTGTQTGPLPGGPDGKPIPPTNKTIGYVIGHVVDMNGLAVTRERQYADSTTMLAQLGVIKAAVRPQMAAPVTRPVVVIAGGTPAEAANVEAFKATITAFNSHDPKAVAAVNAPGSMFHDYTQPKDVDSAGNVAAMTEFFKGFPDGKLELTTAWGAGDYVVAEGAFTGTNTGMFPSMGIKKPTGKPVKVRFIEISKMENGKLKDDNIVFDSMALAGQLGLH